MNKRVSERAKELFQKAFHFQVQQKKGTIEMKRSGGKNMANKNRQKFSRRKQFVITALSEAMKEAGISKWKIEGICYMNFVNKKRFERSNGWNSSFTIFC